MPGAAESHNRCSKGSSPDILKVVLMATYKIDMAAALEHLAKRQGITSYEDLSPASRATRTLVGINMSCSIMNSFVCNSLLLVTVIQERNEKYPIRMMTNHNHSSLSILPQSDHER